MPAATEESLGRREGGRRHRARRPPVYETKLVRNRRSGLLQEVTLTEFPPIAPGTDGITYVFARGELVARDHPVVLDGPHRFREPRPGEV